MITRKEELEEGVKAVGDNGDKNEELLEPGFKAVVSAMKVVPPSKPGKSVVWKRLGEYLVEEKLISPERLKYCLNIQKRTGEKLATIAITQGFITEEAAFNVLARQNYLEFYSKILNIENLDMEILDKHMGKNLEAKFLPMKDETGGIFFLIPDPFEAHVFDVAHKYNAPVKLITPSKFKMMLELYRWKKSDMEKIVDAAVEDISEGQIRALMDYLMISAILSDISDIHIEPSRNTTNVRYRKDGVMMSVLSMPLNRHTNILNVLVILAKKDPSEARHKGIDGSFVFETADGGVKRDVRFSSIPSIYGPAIVMRLLREQNLIGFNDLGMDRQTSVLVKEIIKMPHGIILFTGPTGSGKTTSLYAILKELNTMRNKILTVEDPVEIKLPGVTQVQVGAEGNLTFSGVIKSFLRQDPDIIFVGEIRDRDTLIETFRAANTGHLVFSTLHTNSAVEAIVRLVDMGMPSYMVSSIISIVSQRLVRKLCPYCKTKVPVAEFLQGLGDEMLENRYIKILSLVDLKGLDNGHLYFPSPGCTFCFEGFNGRVPVMEVLVLGPMVRDLMRQAVLDTDKILEMARANNFLTMGQKAAKMILEGNTTVHEVEKVVPLVEVSEYVEGL